MPDFTAEFVAACRRWKPEWNESAADGQLWLWGCVVCRWVGGVREKRQGVYLDFSDDRASADALVLLVQELGRLGYLNIQFDDWGAPAANRIMLMATRTDDDQIHREGPTMIAAVARALMRAWEDVKP